MSWPIPHADIDPWLQAAPDWERTIAYREYLWDLGLGVAEAMDTAQRGMGLDWPMALELIKRSVAAARGREGAVVFSGAGTDHLDPAGDLHGRRRDPRLRGADRRHRGGRRPHHPDGLARPGARRPLGRRLCPRLPARALPGARSR